MTPHSIQPLVRSTVFQFSNPAAARGFSDRSIKPMPIILGDCSEGTAAYWVVTMSDAARLERAGFEILPRV